MRTRNIFLMSLLVVLSGCQPETPVQQVAQPAASTAAAPAPTQPAEPAAVEEAAQPVVKEKIAAVKEKAPQPAVAEKPAQTAPAPAVAALPVKAEPAPAIEAKPEVKLEPAVSEAEAMQLAKKNNCFACHAIDKKVIGPAWKDVAAKYRGDTGAEARLSDKIAKGGSGVWGAMAMPASPQVSEADRKTLARFVLSLK